MLITLGSKGQLVGEVDFDKIKSNVSDANNAMYYPMLFTRLIERDEGLGKQEYYHLYYGNIYQAYYHPYGTTARKKDFLNAYSTETDYEKLLTEGQEVLKENPVDLEVLLKVVFLCSKTKNKELALSYAEIYVSFLEVIYNSGDGKTCESGFVVISVDDEYQISTDLGLTVIRQSLVGECDWLIYTRKGQKRKTRIKELYFNVRMPLTYLSNSYNKSDLPDADLDPDEEE